jgi:phage recombination protein Bet
MTTEVATRTPSAVALTQDDIQTLVASNIIPQGTPEPTIRLFARVCAETGLSPFSRQIHLVKRPSKDRGDTFTIQTGVDGYRAIADRTGQYAGNDDPIFDDEGRPSKATVTVWKLVGGQRFAFTATARMGEYRPQDPRGAFMWDRMPHLMVGKCAEILALRKAFPAELSKVRADEEMEIVDDPEGSWEAQAPPPPVTVQGATFGTFDPSKEAIGFGKYKGMKWVDVPIDYVEWVAHNGKPDMKSKAEATVKIRAQVKDQIPKETGNVMDAVFQEEPRQEPPPQEQPDPVFTKSQGVKTHILGVIESLKSAPEVEAVGKTAKSHLEAGDLTQADFDEVDRAVTKRLGKLLF